MRPTASVVVGGRSRCPGAIGCILGHKNFGCRCWVAIRFRWSCEQAWETDVKDILNSDVGDILCPRFLQEILEHNRSKCLCNIGMVGYDIGTRE